MRGNTIQIDNIRRSTKHIKIGRRAYPIAKKWEALLTMVEEESYEEQTMRTMQRNL